MITIGSQPNTLIRECNDRLLQYITENAHLHTAKYVDLGVQIVRILCYTEKIVPILEKQLTYTLRDSADHFDATILVWNEQNICQFSQILFPQDTMTSIDISALRQERHYFSVGKEGDFVLAPTITCDIDDGIIHSYDDRSNTYFYGIADLTPEVFAKQGHVFFRQFYQILKKPGMHLVHGACIGIDGKGILMCARGHRGKSTLTVLSMIEGFEYVSDDYLTIQKEEEQLYAYPIYSIMTLSHTMYNEMYDGLAGARFVTNHHQKDKYIFNIANFHDHFRTKYPIQICMFPEIVSDPEPSITEISGMERGRAITHIVHSTTTQAQDVEDTSTVRKLIGMIGKYKFYKINLCHDIYKNVEFLREFIEKLPL